jgi:hypothetical protein
MISAAGNKSTTAIGDIYRSKFIEFNFSLQIEMDTTI